jgi:hypothetical protein
MSEPCPCNLTRAEIMWLDDKGHVRLGDGGVCRNPCLHGNVGEPCGKLLAEHPSEGKDN